MRACKFTIQPDIRVHKYTVFGLRMAANGSLWPDLVENSRSIEDGPDNPCRVFFVSHLPAQRVQELEELVLKAVGRDVANSESWVRSCLEQMRRTGMITGREREDAVQGIGRAGSQM